MSIVREIYEGFQRGELNRWDPIVSPDVEIYSPGMWNGRGIEALKTFASEFVTALSPRIDLVDEFDGGERAFLTFCMHWHHVAPFFGIAPTGRRGTSVETLLLTVRGNKVVRFGVADNTLDLAIYLWERGFPQQHNVTVVPIVRGIERG
jgi:SnoaL-like protein